MPPNKTNKSRKIEMAIQEPAAQTPPATPPAPNAPGRPYEQSPEKATLNAIEKLWIIGPWLIVIYRIWSLQGLILFLFGMLGGAIIISLLFLFSVVPVRLLPEKYRGQQTTNVGDEQRVTPHGDLALTEVAENNEWKSWLDDYFLLAHHDLVRFGVEYNPTTTVKKLSANFSSPTTEFPWRFSVDQSHRIISVRGFRVTNTGLIYAISHDDNESTVTFKVPASGKGDTLVAIASTVSRTPKDDKDPVFQSSAP